VSRSRSDEPSTTSGATSDPLRPSDAIDGIDSDDSVTSPKLGFVGWMRWGWRQLTSMRTALVLLLLLAIAAVPGSIVPQRSADPNGVVQWKQDNPALFPILDHMQMFDVYTSAWFSAIYILLFISLIGCVIPRTRHHWQALRARPPRTPARLSRLADHRDEVIELAPGTDAAVAAEHAIDVAQQQLRRAGYRVERYDGRGVFSVSAERGYLRETGNLVFHASLVGVLLAVGIGGGLTYTGQRVVVEGQTFVDALTDFDSFNPGRFVNSDALVPYTLSLQKFDVTYQPYGKPGSGQAGDFVAHVTTQLDGGRPQSGEVRVNHPLDLAGDRVYLLGNGYAPTVTVRNAKGDIVFHDSIPFLPQDANLTSLGVIKIPDGLPEQLGLVGFFYPTSVKMSTGAFTSAYPALVNPVLTLNVYGGDLGINNGTPRSVYALDQTGMTQLTGGKTGVDSIELEPGKTAQLPKGMGTITFDDMSPAGSTDGSQSVKRFVSLSIHHDAAGPWVLLFAAFAVAGLVVALFVPRRRMWVKARPDGAAVRLEYAGLARGEDPTLGEAVGAVADKHVDALRTGGATAVAAASGAPENRA
jgi:cytochrome c biogenesis protein